MTDKEFANERDRKLYIAALKIHDLWYMYRETTDKPTADGFFEWIEGYVL